MDDKSLQGALAKAKGFSPYLSNGLDCEKALVARLGRESPQSVFQQMLDEAFREIDSTDDTSEVMRGLRLLKRRASLLIGLCDLACVWRLEEITTALSALADISVRLALRHLLRKACRDKTIDLADTNAPEKSCGIMIAGVGKLGGFELNYSSDIDILVLYEEARIKTAEPDVIPALCIRLTKQLVRMLDEKTADGYVFRTDLRLRPDPGSMPLAISFKSAEIYYGSFGQNWERAAMIKARPIAGNEMLARDFNTLMKAWIWRRSLDFAAIQDIHSIKRQIDVQNTRKNGQQDGLFGFNVKLGHGGIREIEFFAQTQQLIYGGKNPGLRSPKTLDALTALAKAGHVDAQTANEMADVYIFLRTIEHRLQMIDDRQTHSLPDNARDMALLAQFAGYADTSAFTRLMEQHLTRVRGHYMRLFGESPSLANQGSSLVFTGTEDDPETIKTLTEMGFATASIVAATIRGWHHGRYRATRSDRARQILTELVPALLGHFCKTAHPDDAFIRFDGFLAQLPAGVPIFSMFQKNPDLLSLVADIMGTSPLLAEHLGKHPQSLEGVLNRDFFSRLPDAAFLTIDLRQLLTVARDYEDVLDLIRKWARGQRFQAGIHILKALSPSADTGRYLSDVARTSVAALLAHVKAEFEQQHGTFKTGGYALIAMGGLGSSDMTVSSDIDLVAVYEPPEGEEASSGIRPLPPGQYYIRLTQRLLTALTAPTAEGKLYDADMRLRPSGNDGPLAVSVSGFLDYEASNAWIWEHMCLLRADAIDGQDDIRQKITRGVANILTRPRDPGVLLADILSMRQKIADEYPAQNLWDVKYRRGGLIDIMFITQYLVLLHAHVSPGLLPAQQIPVALSALARYRHLPTEMAESLAACYRFLRGIEQFLTLTVEKPFNPERASLALKQSLALSVSGQADFSQLEKTLLEKLDYAAQSFKTVFNTRELPGD